MGVDANEPGLFDLPEPGAQVAPSRGLRGRNRETWICTVTASVSVVDAAALQAAAAQAQENPVTIVLLDDSDEAPDDVRPTAGGALDALDWLIWPTDGMNELLEAGAFRVLSMGLEVVSETSDRGTVTWSVMVKLTDVGVLRGLATDAHPDEAGEIADSLAVAWALAADPFAPLRLVVGIAWSPGPVVVEHQPARPARSR